MLKRKHSKKRFFVVIIAVAISLLAIFISRKNIENEMQIQLHENLRDVAVQNQVTIESLLNSKQDMLRKIAEQISNSSFQFESAEDFWRIVDWLQYINSIYDFKRMGIIAADGTAYTTDGYAVMLKDEPYWYGIEGMENISSTLTDAVGTAEPINVFSVPIFGEDGKTVHGILFATYRTENFKQLLNIDSFNGEGYSYIVRKNGNVITDSAQSPMYGTTNVFDTMLAYSNSNKSVVENLMSEMEKGESGYETFYSTNARSLYYTPLNVDAVNQTWYLFTIVPAGVLEEKAETVFFYQDLLVLVVALAMTGLVLYFVITYQRDERLLRNMAYIDPLTNGNNRPALYDQLRTRGVHWGYMVALDINDFKLVNSICGINKGNEAIIRIWQILDSNMGPREVAAHLGGDHYVMYMQEVYRDKLISRIQKISSEIEALAEELQIINIFPYFGIYEINKNREPEENYNCAEQAKKLVKGNKNKNWAFYDDINFEKMVEDKQLVDSFKSAIENNEFEIWYQPKYSANTSQMVGAEALVRWRKSDGTLIPPYRFIPIFEGNGMIVTLDEYVFRKVCEQQRQWQIEGKKAFPISVNVSRASLYFSDIVDKYKKIVSSCNISTKLVPLELTESATSNNSQIRGLIERFREAGFSLHLDDFGSGYSSLAMLNLIHFDVLKLDKSLVDSIGDKDGEKLVVYTIKLAKSMGMSITAEGVETKSQVEFLDKLECDEIQGYYFSKPLPVEDFDALLCGN